MNHTIPDTVEIPGEDNVSKELNYDEKVAMHGKRQGVPRFRQPTVYCLFHNRNVEPSNSPMWYKIVWENGGIEKEGPGNTRSLHLTSWMWCLRPYFFFFLIELV
jgi:hypothetical protein